MKRIQQAFISGLTLLVLVGSAFMASAAGVSAGEQVVFRKTADNFIVMYDSSSSMGDRYEATEMLEIEVEKQILREKFATLPELDWQAGIYSFTPAWSMSNFKPFLSMRTYNKNEFMGVIDSLPGNPAGWTPLQGGLVGLGEVLGTLSGKTVVFLFTDGQYTLQTSFSSPGNVAKGLAEKHDVCFQVISTGKEKANYKAIKAIASVNECSAIVPFSGLLGHPEWLTDTLFNVQTVAAAGAGATIAKNEVAGTIAGKVLFDFDKANIKDESKDALINLSIFLKENPEARVVLAGHTDNVGGGAYNMKLSQRRAESARTYLVEKMGVTPDRITLSWFGKGEPVASNDTEAGRAQNRRVTVVITGK